MRNSSEVYGTVNIQGVQVPIAGIAGDQQAALFGQACFFKGEAKNTYGTGCFLLMNTGDQMVHSKNGLLTTIAAGLGGKISYALEGSVFVGGAVIQWVRDQLRFVTEAADTEYFAQKVADNGGVYIVPAFTGLGAPHWDMYARGAILGVTRGTSREHIIRAALESIAYQTCDVLARDGGGYRRGTGKPAGGRRRFAPTGFLMQFQADMIGRSVLRPGVAETTALGAAFLAGLAVGVWRDLDEIRATWKPQERYLPQMQEQQRQKLLRGWRKAVSRALDWAEEE